MSVNLLKMLQDQMGDSVMDQASKFLGENSSVTKSGVNALLPTLMGGLINKGDNESGASAILDMITKGNYDGGILDNLGGLFSGGSSTSNFMNSGSLVTSSLFGGSKLGSVLDVVTRITGMRRSSSSSLMNLLAPMVMGMVGKYVKKNGLNARGLMDMLFGQKEHVASAIPADLASTLGWAKTSASVTNTAKTTASTATATARTATKETVAETSRSGGGIMRWAVPLLLLLGVGYWLMNKGGAETVSGVVNDGTEMVSDAAGNAADAAGTAVNATGDAVKGASNAVGNAAENAVDAAGNAVDAAGNAVGNAANNAADAVKGAAMSMEDIVKGASAKGYSHTVDASGNLINVKTKQITAKAGEWSTNANGVVVDASGKTMSGVAKFGEMIKGAANKTGNAIGNAASKTGNAIGNAASKTGDALSSAAAKAKAKFSNAFKPGVKAAPVALSDMEWDGEKIKSFDKAEFEGLAATLKANPDAKVTIESFGDKQLVAKGRAEWVKNMMVTLGVNKSQISTKGTKEAGNNGTQLVVTQ